MVSYFPCQHFWTPIDQSRDAPGVEVIQPGEKEKIQAVAEQFNRFQMMNFNEHHHCLRGTHLKTQGVRLLPHLCPTIVEAYQTSSPVRGGQIYCP